MTILPIFQEKTDGNSYSISRNGLLKSCARLVIERSEIRKKQHDFKSVHGAFLHDVGEKSTLVDFFSIECRKINWVRYLMSDLISIGNPPQD